MKNLKPLALAAAVSAVTAGYAGVVNAQAVIDAGHTGDLAIVPYYTVQEGFITGVNIINTSAKTQVVKIRFRRGSDSMDALDFNVVLSPEDIFNGFISGDDENSVVFSTQDSSCTAPNIASGKFPMPNAADADPGSTVFNDGAMEGYVEIIAMAQPIDENQPIAVGAKHSEDGIINNLGVPANCDTVADNFFRNAILDPADSTHTIADPTNRGVVASDMTYQRSNSDTTPYQTGTSLVVANSYEASDANALSVSYFVRDKDSGLEFGGRAVHVSGFSTEAMMSNQSKLQTGVNDPYGFYFPDLDGGSYFDTTRGRYDAVDGVRVALGVHALMNNWALGDIDRDIDSDWVVTLPGQYLMVDLPNYVESLENPAAPCLFDSCDNRDLPVQASIEYWDREEAKVVVIPGEDELVISPASSTPPPIEVTKFETEVNVIRWLNTLDDDDGGSLGSEYSKPFPVGEAAELGWARLTITAVIPGEGPQVPKVCTPDNIVGVPATCIDVVNSQPPMIGFAAWKRSFDDDLSNYGRLVEHAFVASSGTP